MKKELTSLITLSIATAMLVGCTAQDTYQPLDDDAYCNDNEYRQSKYSYEEDEYCDREVEYHTHNSYYGSNGTGTSTSNGFTSTTTKPNYSKSRTTYKTKRAYKPKYTRKSTFGSTQNTKVKSSTPKSSTSLRKSK